MTRKLTTATTHVAFLLVLIVGTTNLISVVNCLIPKYDVVTYTIRKRLSLTSIVDPSSSSPPIGRIYAAIGTEDETKTTITTTSLTTGVDRTQLDGVLEETDDTLFYLDRLKSKNSSTIQQIDENTRAIQDETDDSVSDDSLRRRRQDDDDDQTDQTVILTMMGLIFMVGSLSSLDRVAMSVAIVPMGAEMSLTDTDKGSISAFFSVGYGIGILPAGLVLSTLSPRLVMACGIALWSIGTLITPLAAAASVKPDNYDMTFLWTARAVVGASESVVVPTIQRLLSSWIPPEKKSLAVATVFCGFQLGTILAYSLSPVVIESSGGDWRSIFYVYGGAGLLFLIPWMLLSHDAHPQIESKTTAEDDESDTSNNIVQSATAVLKSAPWKDLLRSKATWAMFLAHAANNWGLYNNLSWTPTFYNEQYGLNVKESTLLLVLPSIAGAVGGLTAGSVADSIIQRLGSADSEEDITRIRKIFQFVALFGPAMCLFLLSNGSIPDQPTTAVALLSIAIFLQSFNAAGYGAANQEKSGPKWTGLLYAATSLPSVVVGTGGVYLTGKILDATGQDWSLVFSINACVYVIGAVAFVALYNSKQEFE
jgi:MFS transporter, ACS family, solute carrier family 17 (sodium-dependent inorganic phosphate cotransporter), other